MHRPIFAVLVAALLTTAAAVRTADGAAAEQAAAPAPQQAEPTTGAEPQEAAAATEEPAAEETAPADAENEARRAKVLAVVGGRSLTAGAFEDQLSSPRIPAPTRATYADPEVLRREFDQRVERMTIAMWAEKQGLDRRADVVREVRKLYRGITLYRHVGQAVTDESVTDAEVAAFYEEHRDWYNRPETVKAGLILLADRTQAETALGRALAAKGNRADLVKIVRELSTDEESKRQSGAVGVFDRDGRLNRAQGHGQPEPPPVDAAIVAAAFTLTTPYDVFPQVVDTARGPAVVFLFNRTEAVSRAVEEVASRIRPELLNQRRTATADAFIAEARERYHVKVNDAAFEHVVVAPSPPEALGPPGGMGHGGMGHGGMGPGGMGPGGMGPGVMPVSPPPMPPTGQPRVITPTP